ncbi:MAG: outer membrane protein assembly factor BamD [Phycisphaerae bacterium]|nr:outer membrane protein assembly factor BamD [Phycisphaerae bacterium]
MRQTLMILLLAIALAGISGCSGTVHEGKIELPAILNDGQTPEFLMDAVRAYQNDNLKEAKEIAKDWLDENEESLLADRAMFIKATALYQEHSYYSAAEQYKKLIELHDGSVISDLSVAKQVELAELFLNGATRLLMGFLPVKARTDGLALLDDVSEYRPGSDISAKALMMAADYYFKTEQYLEAQSYCQMLLDTCPKSPQAQRAMLLNGYSTHWQYRGFAYDTNCLNEALVRYQQYQLYYPEDAKEKNIQGQIDLVRTQQALKIFDIADFYLRTGETEAAVKSWESVVRDFPDSQWEKSAMAKIQEYGNEIDEN